MKSGKEEERWEGKHRCNGRNGVEEIDTSRKRTEEEKYSFGTDRSSPFVFLPFLPFGIEANCTNSRIIGKGDN